SWRAQWTIPARRAHEGRDCGAAEIQRITKNASRWPDMNLAAEHETEAPYCGAGAPPPTIPPIEQARAAWYPADPVHHHRRPALTAVAAAPSPTVAAPLNCSPPLPTAAPRG